jgi:hypothetical protein
VLEAPKKKNWVVGAIRSIALKVFGAPFYKKVRKKEIKTKHKLNKRKNNENKNFYSDYGNSYALRLR